MATFYRPAQLLAQMQKRATTHVKSMRDAHRELVKGGVQDHAQLTSGSVSSKTLAQMGHPFGRASGGGARGIVRNKAKFKNGKVGKRGNVIRKGVLMPLPINKQTGKLRRSYFQTPETGANRKVDMGFRVRHAKSVLSPTGTKRMVARGFYSVRPGAQSLAELGEIAKRHRARKAGIIAAARKKALFP